ncbi:MAG: Hpt domain-containing protein [Patescibacteria group bacterium]|jgi:chemotaxis protein histidine kinase CheA
MADLQKYEETFLRQTRDIAGKLQEVLKILISDLKNEVALREGERLAHVLKGSAALMRCENLSKLAEKIEEFFRKSLENTLEINQDILKEIENFCLVLLRTSNFEELQSVNFKIKDLNTI